MSTIVRDLSMSKAYTGLGIVFACFLRIEYCFKKESIPLCLLPATTVSQESENIRNCLKLTPMASSNTSVFSFCLLY